MGKVANHPLGSGQSYSFLFWCGSRVRHPPNGEYKGLLGLLANMRGKTYTFFIASTPGKLRKVVVPAYLIHGVAILALIGAISVTAAVASYSRMLWKVGNYNAVRHELETRTQQYRQLQATVNDTNQRLDSLQSLATEVAMTYGVLRYHPAAFDQADNPADSQDAFDRSVEQYNLHEGSRHIYSFFWHEFCDWYLEMIKLHPERSKPTLLYVFESALRLLHPFMPFITEELWQNVPHKGESIMVAPYPEFDPELVDERAEAEADLIQEIVVKVRNIRAEMNVDAKQAVPVRVATTDSELTLLLADARDYVFKLAQVSQLEILPELSGDRLSARAVAGGLALEVPLAGLIDVEAERARLTKELEKARREIATLERKLSQASFVEKAPKEVVDENRRRLADYQDQAAKLSEGLKRLE